MSGLHTLSQADTADTQEVAVNGTETRETPALSPQGDEALRLQVQQLFAAFQTRRDAVKSGFRHGTHLPH